MSSAWSLLMCVWGIALVLSVPLLAAVWCDSRRGALGNGERGSAASENELIW